MDGRRLASLAPRAPYVYLDVSAAGNAARSLGGRSSAHDLSAASWFRALSGTGSSIGSGVLSIPATALRVSHGYVIAVRAYPVVVSASGSVTSILSGSNTRLAEGWSIVGVGVRRSRLQLGVSGGDRTVSSDGGFTVGASAGRTSQSSIDPDFDTTGTAIDPGFDVTRSTPVTVYQWTCTARAFSSSVSVPCLQLVPGGGRPTAEASVVIPSSVSLTFAGQRLSLSVNTSSGLATSQPRLVRQLQSIAAIEPATLVTGSTSASVSVALPGLPSLEANSQRTRNTRLASSGGATVVSSSVKTIMDAIVNNVAPQDARISVREEGLSLQWTQLSGPVVPGVRQQGAAAVPPGESAVLTSLTARSLVLRAGILIPGASYVF